MALTLLSRLPLPVLYVLADALYLLVHHVLRYRRSVVRDNLRRAFPDQSSRDIDRLMRRFYHNLTDVAVEIVKAMSISAEELERRVHIRNSELLQEFARRRQAVLFMTTHQCNWEWLLLAIGARLELPVDPIYKPLHNRRVDTMMRALRSRFGGRPIAAKDAIVGIMRNRKTSAGFAMVADQTPPKGEEQYWTRFLGHDTSFFVGAEKVARLAGFPVVFVDMRRLRRGHYEVELSVLATPPHATLGYPITERFARLAEQQVMARPAEWLWSHRRWKRPRPLYS